MNDFEATWTLVRGRFDQVFEGLTQEQLNWRLQPGVLTLGEMALHVAGVEASFITQLQRQEPEGLLARLKSAATDGVVNDGSFPFAVDEITPALVKESLELARSLVAPVAKNPTEEIRARQIKSALGPIVDGTGALARLAYHPGYHQGQAHIVKSSPGFPKG
ncbi:MAG: DinB family protein [Fimbriimonadaceae bacterium]|nr:DinB family protein [Fimbriimonadaceae bacterium]QYK54753.1 MAG: DinB family protein [Fimbriimonadaceae bacterium]